MLSRVWSSAVHGVDALPIEIETHAEPGLPRWTVVGLPDGAVRESRDRVRAALKNAGLPTPRGAVTVNLAPADVRKEGSAFDLPIALGLLAALGSSAGEVIAQAVLDELVILGELSLDGSLRPVRGVLPSAVGAREAGRRGLLVPHENAAEAAVVEGVEVYPVRTLREAFDLLSEHAGRGTPYRRDEALFDEAARASGYAVDFADVRGQGHVKRALEVGHWLNLLHIWGDDQYEANQCSWSDECGDTPNQADENYGTPSFPQVSCGNGPNGDMFMNYMDYVNDAAMFMFTQDQATRMHATLSVARTGLLASDGLVPVGMGSPVDLWMQDNADDTGAEPDSSANPMWISDDIWVRNGADGLTNQDHQNPRSGEVNRVYVRVRNRGCSGGSALSGTVKLYWA